MNIIRATDPYGPSINKDAYLHERDPTINDVLKYLKQPYLRLYSNRIDAIRNRNPFNNRSRIKTDLNINLGDTRKKLWYGTDNNQKLIDAQKRLAFSKSKLPDDLNEKIGKKFTQKAGKKFRKIKTYKTKKKGGSGTPERRLREETEKLRSMINGDDLNKQENIQNDEISRLKNKIDELEIKQKICCKEKEMATENIQRVYRGHQGRNTFKQTRRSMKPNVTDALLDMPMDVGDLIATNRKKIDYKTKGWTIINDASAWEGIPSRSIDVEMRGRGVSIEIRKNIIEDMGLFGYTESKGDHFHWWPRDQATKPDDILNNISVQNQRDTYVVPGVSFKLIKQKIDEGFNIDFENPEDELIIRNITDSNKKGGLNKKKDVKKINSWENLWVNPHVPGKQDCCPCVFHYMGLIDDNEYVELYDKYGETGMYPKDIETFFKSKYPHFNFKLERADLTKIGKKRVSKFIIDLFKTIKKGHVAVGGIIREDNTKHCIVFSKTNDNKIAIHDSQMEMLYNDGHEVTEFFSQNRVRQIYYLSSNYEKNKTNKLDKLILDSNNSPLNFYTPELYSSDYYTPTKSKSKSKSKTKSN